jgi:hypothetical protein
MGGPHLVFVVPLIILVLHIDTEEGRGLILYIDNKLEATEIHMETNIQENLFV